MAAESWGSAEPGPHPSVGLLAYKKGSKPNKINNLIEMTAPQTQSPLARKLPHNKVHHQINPISALSPQHSKLYSLGTSS